MRNKITPTLRNRSLTILRAEIRADGVIGFGCPAVVVGILAFGGVVVLLLIIVFVLFFSCSIVSRCWFFLGVLMMASPPLPPLPSVISLFVSLVFFVDGVKTLLVDPGEGVRALILLLEGDEDKAEVVDVGSWLKDVDRLSLNDG